MCRGKICFVALLALALRAADAARVGSEPAALTAWKRSPKCQDIEGTATFGYLKKYGVTTRHGWCYCFGGYFPSHGCRQMEEVKDHRGATWRSFRLAAANMTSCECLSADEKVLERAEENRCGK